MDTFERIRKLRDLLKEEATALDKRSEYAREPKVADSFTKAAEAIMEADRELQWAQVAVRDGEVQSIILDPGRQGADGAH